MWGYHIVSSIGERSRCKHESGQAKNQEANGQLKQRIPHVAVGHCDSQAVSGDRGNESPSLVAAGSGDGRMRAPQIAVHRRAHRFQIRLTKGVLIFLLRVSHRLCCRILAAHVR
ncbi:hypothetical protein PENTCL1PPCAC_10878, partial [Pristionchus entomophagus]